MKMLEFAPGIWPALMDSLRRRGAGRRESGAFLLGEVTDTAHIVRAWVLYDQLDPTSLHYSYVRLQSGAFSRLWEICSDLNLTVAADVHTHPKEPCQSPSDRANPMISLAGHIALIVPRFGRGTVLPRDVSYNVYLGHGKWESYFHDDAASLIKLLEEVKDEGRFLPPTR